MTNIVHICFIELKIHLDYSGPDNTVAIYYLFAEGFNHLLSALNAWRGICQLFKDGIFIENYNPKVQLKSL